MNSKVQLISRKWNFYILRCSTLNFLLFLDEMGVFFSTPITPITRELLHRDVDFTFDAFDEMNKKIDELNKNNEMSNLEMKNHLLELNKKLDKILSKQGKNIIITIKVNIESTKSLNCFNFFFVSDSK